MRWEYCFPSRLPGVAWSQLSHVKLTSRSGYFFLSSLSIAMTDSASSAANPSPPSRARRCEQLWPIPSSRSVTDLGTLFARQKLPNASCFGVGCPVTNP